MNFHTMSSMPIGNAENPKLTFFNHALGLSDRETLPINEHGSDERFSPSFAASIEGAVRVWIVDRYLADEPELAEELFCFVTVNNVEDTRIITGDGHNVSELAKIAEHWDLISNRTGRIHIGCLPSRSTHISPIPHDRFAIVDTELWHWGATVGGGYSGQNACSRGWDANRTRAVSWFEDLWDYAKR